MIANHNSQITGLRRQPIKCRTKITSKDRHQRESEARFSSRSRQPEVVAPCYAALSFLFTLQPLKQQHLTESPPTSLLMTELGTTMATPAFSLREDDLVTLLIGPDEHKFVVHESCITRNSDFFTAAMKKEWTEGQTRIIKLPEETNLETFAHYLNLAYHGKLPTEDIKKKVKEFFFRRALHQTRANLRPG